MKHLKESLTSEIYKWNLCQGRTEAQRMRAKHLEEVIAKNKALIALQPEVVEFLEAFQQHSHQKSVGVYEELLSALVNEVLPGNRKIQMQLSTERSLPALEILSVKDGKPEDIMEGSGGSLVNIISAGLRIIALARSSCAPFLLLDEADCWLSPLRVPQFGAIIGQVARDIGIQVLMITHHDARFFDSYAHLLRLVKRAGNVNVDTLSSMGAADSEGLFGEFGNATSPGVPEELSNGKSYLKMKERRIESLILENFMSHKRSELNLASTVTCVTGENDIGKSAIAAALRSIWYGDSSDSFVRHDEKFLRVTAKLNTGESVVFEHFLKKSPKRRWQIFANGGQTPIMDASPKHGTPTWLADIFKVERFEGLDVQLANQKLPVFLLNEAASKRAAILSIGSESNTLQEMIALNKKQVQELNVLVSSSESQHAMIKRQLDALHEYEKLGDKLSQLLESVCLFEKQMDNHSFFEEKLKRFEQLKALDGVKGIEFKNFVEIKKSNVWNEKLFRQEGLLKIKEIKVLKSLQTNIKIKYGFEKEFVDFKRSVTAIEVKVPRSLATKGANMTTGNWLKSLSKYERYSNVIHGWSIAPSLMQTEMSVLKPVFMDKVVYFRRLSTVLNNLEIPKQLKNKEIVSNFNLENLLKKQDICLVHKQKVAEANKQLEDKRQQINEKIDSLYHELGGKCPLCHQSFKIKKV